MPRGNDDNEKICCNIRFGSGPVMDREYNDCIHGNDMFLCDGDINKCPAVDELQECLITVEALRKAIETKKLMTRKEVKKLRDEDNEDD